MSEHVEYGFCICPNCCFKRKAAGADVARAREARILGIIEQGVKGDLSDAVAKLRQAFVELNAAWEAANKEGGAEVTLALREEEPVIAWLLFYYRWNGLEPNPGWKTPKALADAFVAMEVPKEISP